VYALRLFIRSMHNRVGPSVGSREIALRDGAVLVPILAAILFLAFYPQLALSRSEESAKAAVSPVQHEAAAPATASVEEGVAGR
jgi:NADH-quinone oxidoreductase subunit M